MITKNSFETTVTVNGKERFLFIHRTHIATRFDSDYSKYDVTIGSYQIGWIEEWKHEFYFAPAAAGINLGGLTAYVSPDLEAVIHYLSGTNFKID